MQGSRIGCFLLFGEPCLRSLRYSLEDNAFLFFKLKWLCRNLGKKLSVKIFSGVFHSLWSHCLPHHNCHLHRGLGPWNWVNTNFKKNHYIWWNQFILLDFIWVCWTLHLFCNYSKLLKTFGEKDDIYLYLYINKLFSWKI